LAAIAANIYYQIFFYASQVDFSAILNPVNITALNIGVSLCAGLLYWLHVFLFRSRGPVIFNFVYSMASFASVLIPMMYTLPLSQAYPEMFTGLSVPMVFFPVIAWMTIDPLIKK
jgi:hypothetical protein